MGGQHLEIGKGLSSAVIDITTALFLFVAFSTS